MRILVFGGRRFQDKEAAWAALDWLHEQRAITILVHGACPVGNGGADMLADAWARTKGGIDVRCYPINQWLDGGWPGCGTARNRRMWADCGRWIEGGVGFPGEHGTAHMKGLMQADGVEVWEPLKVNVVRENQ